MSVSVVPCILRFGSWVGGDMDGHPDVHAKTIREFPAKLAKFFKKGFVTPDFTDTRVFCVRLTD